MLESVDKTYLRSILRCHDKVAIECIYFEVGLLPYKYEIIRRRLMYLWKLLHVDKEELIYRVYRSQQLTSHPGDWVRLVNRDKEAIGLEISDEKIQELSKTKFKSLISKKIENCALVELNQLKMKHEKSEYLHSSSFKTAQYLVDDSPFIIQIKK